MFPLARSAKETCGSQTCPQNTQPFSPENRQMRLPAGAPRSAKETCGSQTRPQNTQPFSPENCQMRLPAGAPPQCKGNMRFTDPPAKHSALLTGKLPNASASGGSPLILRLRILPDFWAYLRQYPCKPLYNMRSAAAVPLPASA